MGAARPWRQTVQIGLLWGVGAVFISLVGLIEALQQRQIITGVISGGHTVLLVLVLVAGLSAARQHAGGGAARQLAAAGFAGAIAALLVALLLVFGTVVNLRAMIVGATPELYAMLSLGRGAAVLPWLVLGGAVAGVAGALLTILPGAIRSLVTTGVVTLLTVGLLQEQVQLLLQAERLARFREIVFTFDGLTPIGAVLVVAVSAAVSGIWHRQRPKAKQRVAVLPPGQRRLLQVVGFAAAVGLMLVIPLFVGPFFSQVLVLVGLYTLMGLGLNLEVGFAGLLDIGFVAFFAVGAYTVGLLTSTGPLAIAHFSWWTATLIAVVVSLISGVLFGLPILGIRGDYLAIATLGFGEIIRLLVLSDYLRPTLGGSQGVLSIPKPILFGFEFRGPEQLFFLTLAASALIAFVAARLRDSRLGRAWMAMREDEDVAQAMGINLVNVKLLAYGIGAIFAGVSGAIFAVMVGSIFPHSFSVLVSINVLALIIVGGMGSLPGVAVGSLFLVGLPELLREFSDYRFLVYGAALMAMMILRPEGLWPSAAQRRELHEEVARIPEGETELAEASGGEA
jgi:branched-chain amino acid transport system permease protein